MPNAVAPHQLTATLRGSRPHPAAPVPGLITTPQGLAHPWGQRGSAGLAVSPQLLGHPWPWCWPLLEGQHQE